MIIAFVPYSEIFAWAARGWVISRDMMGKHGEYSVIMRLDP